MSVLLVGVAIGGVLTLRLPWYHFSFDSTVVTSSYEKVPGVHASLTLMGNQLAALDLSGPGVMRPSLPVGPGGLLAPIAWLLLAGLLGVATALLRSSLFTIGGLVVTQVARSSLDGVRAAMEDPNYGGQYMTAMPGMWWFSMATLAMAALLLLVGFQAFMVNRSERREKIERGEEVSPSMFDILAAVKGSGGVTKILEEAGKVKDDAKAKANKK